MGLDEVQKTSQKRLSSALEEDEPATKRRAASSADKDWNVEECRGDHESIEHWELRKQFLLQNRERFPSRNRLICLSQVFANMEFLGCRYPEETMELVHELSLGIVESYREKQKSRLQRTFVKASDAAERKTKGYSSTNKPSVSSTNYQSSTSHMPPRRTNNGPMNLDDDTKRNDAPFNEKSFIDDPEIQSMILLVYAYNNGENSTQIIHRSCSAANVPISNEFQGEFGNYMCTYTIGKSSQIVAESQGEHQSKETAKLDAARIAFKLLQKHCFTFLTKLKVEPRLDGREVVKEEVVGSTVPVFSEQKIAESNIGNKLLKLMGWTGGGLGKNEQGIHEAISVDGVVGRSRLGLGNDKGTFFQKIKNLLQAQKHEGFKRGDLKFASDFSKDERKDIHMIAKNLGLKSKSYGKDDDRYVVISEKISRPNLLNSILATGGETDKYKVIPPGGSLEGLEDLL